MDCEVCDRLKYHDRIGKYSGETYRIRTRDREGGKFIDIWWDCSFLSYKQENAKVMVVKLEYGYTDIYRLNYNIFGL